MKYPYVQIVGEKQLEEILKLDMPHFNCCISIGNPGDLMLKEIKNKFKTYLRLEFHDIDKKEDLPKSENGKPASLNDIKKIINFYNLTKNKVDGYTIHCHAGVHRSVAVGLGILYLIYGSEERVLKEYYKLRPLGLPNKNIINLFDKVLNSNLKKICTLMWKKMRDFLDGKITINHDDYLEELPIVESKKNYESKYFVEMVFGRIHSIVEYEITKSYEDISFVKYKNTFYQTITDQRKKYFNKITKIDTYRLIDKRDLIKLIFRTSFSS